MAISLLDIIQDYQETADKTVGIFKTHFDVDDILEGWHRKLYSQTGELKEHGVDFYAFHGIGLAVNFQDKFIDFDFAFFPEPRHDGFDIWRLTSFIEGQSVKYSEYLNQKRLKSEFEKLITKKIIFKPNLVNSTTLYFLNKEKEKKPFTFSLSPFTSK